MRIARTEHLKTFDATSAVVTVFDTSMMVLWSAFREGIREGLELLRLTIPSVGSDRTGLTVRSIRRPDRGSIATAPT